MGAQAERTGLLDGGNAPSAAGGTIGSGGGIAAQGPGTAGSGGAPEAHGGGYGGSGNAPHVGWPYMGPPEAGLWGSGGAAGRVRSPQ